MIAFIKEVANMGLFGKKQNGGLMDEIRCDESSYLIWKWHPVGSSFGNNNRENAIRWGSSLRVKEGEVAVFVYHQDDGVMQEFIEGPFDEILETRNLPVLASIIGLSYDGGTPFQAEVYFINLAQIIQVKFGVPFFDVYDPRFLDFGVPVAVRGTISFRIADYSEFIKKHRLNNFVLEDFQEQVRDAVSRYVKSVVTNAPAENNIPVVQLESKISMINDSVEYDVKERLGEEFGVEVSSVDIGKIELDKASDGYKQLMSVTKDIASEKAQAEKDDYIARLNIRREEEQYSIHKATQSANLAAFQVEKQAEIGIAGAEALGQMGQNGAGAVSLGGETSFNPAAMMAGMTLGGAVGQNIAGVMNASMNGLNEQPLNNNVTPPPLPSNLYHVAVGGQDIGTYEVKAIEKMVSEGTIKDDCLVWKTGMTDWVKASSMAEFASFFSVPPIPKGE